MSGRRPLEGFGVFKVFRISGFRGELSEAGMRVEGRELVGLFAVASARNLFSCYEISLK